MDKDTARGRRAVTNIIIGAICIAVGLLTRNAWSEPVRVYLGDTSSCSSSALLEAELASFRGPLTEAGQFVFVADLEVQQMMSSCREQVGIGQDEERSCQLKAARRLMVDYVFELCCRPVESTWECALRVHDASGDLVLELLRRGNAETEEAAIREALAGLAAHLLGEAATVQRPISEATTVPDEGVARVVFDCSPSDTELLIDDGSLGPCAALEGAVELSLGEHRLLMRHPGYAAQQQTLRINSPTERRFSVQLARHGLDSTWISVRSGQFQAGSPRTEDGRSDDEVLTTTNIEQPFEIAATELSQREWRLLMGTDISHFSTCGDDCPVDSINWFDALALANAYSELEGFQHCYDLSTCHGTAGIDFACAEAPKAVPGCEGYRLPTGVEWEYAARAGTQSAFYNGRIADGDDDECETDRGLAAIGWYCKNASIEAEGGFDLSKDEGSSRAGTQPRAQLSPNAWGLFDTAGNVAEWTEEGELRGGSFLSYARHCRSAARQTVTAEQRAASQGVRLVRALEHL